MERVYLCQSFHAWIQPISRVIETRLALEINTAVHYHGGDIYPSLHPLALLELLRIGTGHRH